MVVTGKFQMLMSCHQITVLHHDAAVLWATHFPVDTA